MALPTVTESGVLPRGIHDLSLDEVRSLFAANGNKAHLADLFEGFLERLSDVVPFPVNVYLDGRFITEWEGCSDIDVILEAREFGREKSALLVMLMNKQVRTEFVEDFKVVLHVTVPGLGPKDHRQWFQRVRPDEAWRFGLEIERLYKGIVRLTPCPR